MTVHLEQSNSILFYDKPNKADIQDWVSGLSNKAELFTSTVNSINQDMLQCIDTLASEASTIAAKLRESSDSLSTLLVVSGRNNGHLSPFLEDIRYTSDGIYFDKQSETLSLDFVKKNHDFKTRLSSSSMVELGIPTDGSIKFSDIDNIRSKTTYCGFHNYGRSCAIDLDISLIEKSSVSGISFNCNTFGAVPPRITGVKYRSGTDMINVVINKTNSFQVDLSLYEFDSKIEIDFNEIKTDRLVVSIVQPNRVVGFSNAVVLGINELQVYSKTYVDGGHIVFGPLDFNDEVLKVAANLNISNFNYFSGLVKLELSTNQEDWLELSPSSGSSNSPKKVISFNTIDKESVKTNSPVRRLYLKLSLFSVHKENFSSEAIYTKGFFEYAGSETSYYLGTEFNNENSNVVSSSARNIFGIRDSLSSIEKEVLLNRNLQNISSNGSPILRSDKTLEKIDNATFFTSARRLPITHDKDFRHKMSEDSFADISTLRVMSYSNPSVINKDFILREGIHVDEHVIYGLKLKPEVEPGIYVLIDGKNKYEVDLSAGVIQSNEGMVFEVVSSNPYLYLTTNGYKIYLAIETIEDKNYVSLTRDLCIAPISDFTYKYFYPVMPINENEFTVSNSGILSPLSSKIRTSIAIIRKSNLPFVYEDSTKSLIISNPTFSKHIADMSQFNYKYSAFLGRTGIINNTIEFDNSAASLNSFIKEVPFQDGETEFRALARYTQVVSNLNPVNQFNLDPYFIDNENIVFNDAEDLFINRVYSEDELLFKGDYLISGHTVSLPNDVLTSDVLDLIIDYDIENKNKTISGLYSVDYSNGSIYSSAPIDGNIKITFFYSNVFMSGYSGKKISKSNYSIEAGSIRLKSSYGSDFRYMVIADLSTGKANTSIVSPVVNSLDINYISASERF